jgi:predicted permease
MHAVLNAALPIFALILTGFLCARFGGFDRTATQNLNRFAFYLALPALLFGATSRIHPDEIRQAGFSMAFAGAMMVTFAIGFALCRWRGRSVAQSSIEGLDAGYSNVGFMGIPLCLLVFGEAGLPPAIITTLFTGCALFLFAIVLVETDLKKGTSLGRTAGKILVSLGRNPLLIAPLAGLAVGLSGLAVPFPLQQFATLLGGAASPLALICIGLFLAQERLVSRDAKSIGTLVVLKLVFQPSITALLVFYVCDVPPLWARAAVLLSALPIGSGPFTIAKLYGLEAGVTSGAILISHILSVATVSLLVAWLG